MFLAGNWSSGGGWGWPQAKRAHGWRRYASAQLLASCLFKRRWQVKLHYQPLKLRNKNCLKSRTCGAQLSNRKCFYQNFYPWNDSDACGQSPSLVWSLRCLELVGAFVLRYFKNHQELCQTQAFCSNTAFTFIFTNYRSWKIHQQSHAKTIQNQTSEHFFSPFPVPAISDLDVSLSWLVSLIMPPVSSELWDWDVVFVFAKFVVVKFQIHQSFKEVEQHKIITRRGSIHMQPLRIRSQAPTYQLSIDLGYCEKGNVVSCRSQVGNYHPQNMGRNDFANDPILWDCL